jgi:phage RecT family recombinase
MAKADGSDVMNKLAKKEDKPKTLADWVNSLKPEIERALPQHINADRIARIAITAIRTNKQLQSCQPMSFIAALMQSSQLGLEPNTPLGEAYIIPYKDKGVRVQDLRLVIKVYCPLLTGQVNTRLSMLWKYTPMMNLIMLTG